MFSHYRSDALERHDGIERGDFDTNHARQREDGMERGVVVRDAARGLIEIERDDRKLIRQLGVIDDRVVASRQRE